MASTIYYGLFALQHRGQESCGIAVSETHGPKGKVSTHKDMGLVNEVFDAGEFRAMKGDIGVGHVRYSTAGASTTRKCTAIGVELCKRYTGTGTQRKSDQCNELRKIWNIQVQFSRRPLILRSSLIISQENV